MQEGHQKDQLAGYCSHPGPGKELWNDKKLGWGSGFQVETTGFAATTQTAKGRKEQTLDWGCSGPHGGSTAYW